MKLMDFCNLFFSLPSQLSGRTRWWWWAKLGRWPTQRGPEYSQWSWPSHNGRPAHSLSTFL